MKLLIALLCATPAFAQQPAPDANLTQTLISEIRQLRISIDRSTNLLPKMQLTVSRMQMQQDHVDRRERELQAIRTRIADQAMGRDRLQNAVKTSEEQARQTQDPVARKQFEEALGSFKAELERQSLREQQDRVLESEALAQLKAEQDKLHDLEQQLDRLDKATQ